MVPLRHFHGRVECDPLARRGGADLGSQPQGGEAVSRWRPGDRRADTGSMLRVDQAGEYGATRIYAGQLAVLRSNAPEAKLVARMAAQEER
ncbi:MAG TPA: demethoxyubiquinone hydroxylase family protein, partial [Dongiaceae bacterium]|nr:demethoxyubiquinone hydroxylase family protein [Dongiaceae bacterium]